MKIALLTCTISPHQIPLAAQLASLVGTENYCYAYTQALSSERRVLGWGDGKPLAWCHPAKECREELENADLLYCGARDFDLMETRLRAGRLTCYMAERWFKPVEIGLGLRLRFPGWVRLLVPSYFRMARRFVKLFESPDFRFLPQGRWAERDMALIYRVFHPFAKKVGAKAGDLGRAGVPPPAADGDGTPSLPDFATDSKDWRSFIEKTIPWGYFVAPSDAPRPMPARSVKDCSADSPLRILWVGRMIGWKRVDTIVRAVRTLDPARFDLTLVGDGPERKSLMRLARGRENIHFVDFMPIERIRDEMRSHDVYVLSSNGQEGWGAALNEAMEEGMRVLGTYEAGSSSYMLPETNLFHAGDRRQLAQLLMRPVPFVPICNWSAKSAAKHLMELVK